MSTPPRLVHFRAAGTSLLLDLDGHRIPSVVHWGPDLGPLPEGALREAAYAAVPQASSNTLDQPVPVSVLPEHARGWAGLAGLSGDRDGADWSPLFSVTGVDVGPPAEASGATLSEPAAGSGGRLIVTAADAVACLLLRLEIEMSASGLVGLRGQVTNQHDSAPYAVDGLVLALPVPTEADEILDLTGRHLRERSPQRQPFTVGTRLRDSRRGRTGLDATLIMAAGSEGFGFRTGDVWAVHVAWSGNHRTYAERMPTGESLLGGGELLFPGEVRLTPGESYQGPWLYASYGHGLDEMSGRFHEHLRAQSGHAGRRPRPVVLNTWEAVYFDHEVDQLRHLADLGARIGVERYVLDDGWFRGRTSDHAGLGDWYVDEKRWPDGLHPLVDHVRGLGMEFGLWFEPEMINPNSDLARAHPDWVMATGHRWPPEARNQQVLDLAHPEAFDFILGRLDALVGEYAIDFIKWDHNRDLVDAGHSPRGEAGVHAQTAALYRLIDVLRARHPRLEIESCSSGGGRIDLGILARTDRVWGSDCIDALERQQIQRWTELLLPPELIGSHVGAPQAHTTGRRHRLSFRAGTALFGHFGIEWDLRRASPRDLGELATWVALYKQVRGLLHTGVVVRSDHADPAVWVHGVVGQDQSQAVYTIAQMATGVFAPPGRVCLPGLDESAVYRVERLSPVDDHGDVHRRPEVPWLATGGVTLPGRVLAVSGLQAPLLDPEELVLLRATRQ